jgi:hypothetical protein
LRQVEIIVLHSANGMEMDSKTPDFHSWKRCVQLAVDWNHYEIARQSIFNAENRSHWQVINAWWQTNYLFDSIVHKFLFVQKKHYNLG